MTQTEINNLKKELKAFYGSIKEISERSEYTRYYVGLVLKGERSNAKILTVASTVLAERKAEKAKLYTKAQEAYAKAQAIAI